MINELQEFWNFLGSWFPDADIEGVETDEEVVRNFLKTGNTDKIELVKVQCAKVMEMDKLPVDKIVDEANRYFEKESECRAWLQEVFDVLDSYSPTPPA